jgi:peptidoglycan-N-acetylglucosamine deacetylase
MRRATGMSETCARSVLACILLAASVARAGTSDVPRGVIRAGSREEKRIALTFDACATRAPSKVDRGVIDVLVATQTRATFFLGGKWMTDHPSETRLLASLPQFELGNHSYLHPHMPMLDGAKITRELGRTQKILRSLTGRTARWFRPPYGEWSAAVVETAAVLGLRTVLFDLASGDPDPQATSERLIEYVVRKAHNGSIVVMHANGRGWHTAEALPRIISRLRAKGFELVTVGELLEHRRPRDDGRPGTEHRP